MALNGSFPNMAFMGIPVLTAVIGPSAVLPVVVGNLVSSLVLLPVTLALLEAGKSRNRSHQGLAVVWHAVLGSIRQPLVIASIIGVVVALLHVPLPEAVHNSFDLLGSARPDAQICPPRVRSCGGAPAWYGRRRDRPVRPHDDRGRGLPGQRNGRWRRPAAGGCVGLCDDAHAVR